MTINKYSKLYISRLHTKDERMTMVTESINIISI